MKRLISLSEKQKQFINMMEFRHACKLFDQEKKISNNDILYILEAARLSPSSFGMEGWKFLVIQNKILRQKLKPFCWDQEQITSSSHLIVILAAIKDLEPSSKKVLQQFQRRQLPKKQLNNYLLRYKSYITEKFYTPEKLYEWSTRQTYIAATNMMNAAAFIDIDSCPIEGFEKETIENLLQIDTSKYQIALMVAFGYRVSQPKEHLRENLEDIVEFL